MRSRPFPTIGRDDSTGDWPSRTGWNERPEPIGRAWEAGGHADERFASGRERASAGAGGLPVTALPPPGLSDEYDVLAFLNEELRAGRKAALVTLTGLDGPFSRPLGAQIAVAADGRFAGSISGGCLETALVEEACAAIGAGRDRELRYGRGSPFLDVRLPCGGGVDLHVDAAPDPDVIRAALERAAARSPFSLLFRIGSDRSGLRLAGGEAQAGAGEFRRRFQPRLRIILAGRGWGIVALAKLARVGGCEIVVASQERATLAYCEPYADRLIPLTLPTQAPSLPFDADTAFACLFHEHEWETALLLDALRSPAFYVGALGSRQTHERRLETLRELGAGPDDVARLKGPIGLFPSREPAVLAVSALAEILKVRTLEEVRT